MGERGWGGVGIVAGIAELLLSMNQDYLTPNFASLSKECIYALGFIMYRAQIPAFRRFRFLAKSIKRP
jgi:hypothetical protein